MSCVVLRSRPRRSESTEQRPAILDSALRQTPSTNPQAMHLLRPAPQQRP